MIAEFAGVVDLRRQTGRRGATASRERLDSVLRCVLSAGATLHRPGVLMRCTSAQQTHGVEDANRRQSRMLVVGSGALTNRETLSFSGSTDAEVLSEAAAVEGVPTVCERLCGEYAFAIWDDRNSELTLLRDRLGLHAVYYSELPDYIVFSSSALALARLEPGVTRRVDKTVLTRYVAFGSKSSARRSTFFSGVRKVRPGHAITFCGGRRTERRYWHPESLPEIMHECDADYHADLIRLLKDAIVLRAGRGPLIYCDVSGGVDSTSIVSILSEAAVSRGWRIIGRSLVPGAIPKASENDYMACVAESFNLKRHIHDPIECGSLLRFLEPDAPSVDEPSLSILAYPEVRRLFQTMRADGASVHFSGQGADNVFGSPHLLHVLRLLRARRGSDALAVLRYWAAAPNQTVCSLLTRHVLLPLLADPDWRYRYSPPTWLRQRAIATAQYWLRSSSAERVVSGSSRDRQNRLLYVSGSVTHARDAVTLFARCGVCTQLPYYDHNLVEYMARVPGDVLSKPGLSKPLLRSAMAPAIPSRIAEKWYQPGGTLILLAKLQRIQKPLERLLACSRLADYGIIEPAEAIKQFHGLLQGHVASLNAFCHLIVSELWIRNIAGDHLAPELLTSGHCDESGRETCGKGVVIDEHKYRKHCGL